MCYRAFTVFVISALPAFATAIVYNNLPNPIPPSSPSLGFQSQHTSEFGDLIQIQGGPDLLTGATILMSDWAKNADYPAYSPDPWSWPITLNIYNVDNSSGTPEPGSVIYSITQTFAIPWRPPDDPINCPSGGYLAFDGSCQTGGFNFLASFTLPDVAVPGQFIYGIAFDTETFGANPVGVTGPYISLNLAVNDTSPPQTGSRPLPDTAYWNTNVAGNYADGGAAGVGVFRQDQGWTPYSTAAEFTALTPEPGTFTMLGCGGAFLICMSIARKRAARNRSTAH